MLCISGNFINYETGAECFIQCRFPRGDFAKFHALSSCQLALFPRSSRFVALLSSCPCNPTCIRIYNAVHALGVFVKRSQEQKAGRKEQNSYYFMVLRQQTKTFSYLSRCFILRQTIIRCRTNLKNCSTELILKLITFLNYNVSSA